MQRNIMAKMRKINLSRDKAQEAKDAMDIDGPSSSTINQMMEKAFIAMMTKHGGGTQPAKSKSKSTNSGPLPNANTPPLSRKRRQEAGPEEHSRKKARFGQEETPRGFKEGKEGKVWEEVRELTRQVKNLKGTGRNDLPDMYLDISEQARLIYALGNTR